MLAHNGDPIEAGKTAAVRAERDEIKALACDIVDARQREADAFRQW
jgi:uncharacterized protein (DUF305 family)